MSKDLDRLEAKRTIFNGRILILVTALPIIGSLIKTFYLKNGAASGNLDMQNPIVLFIDTFPTVNLNDIYTVDNFIILGFTIGLVVGISTLKRGISQLSELDRK